MTVLIRGEHISSFVLRGWMWTCHDIRGGLGRNTDENDGIAEAADESTV